MIRTTSQRRHSRLQSRSGRARCAHVQPEPCQVGRTLPEPNSGTLTQASALTTLRHQPGIVFSMSAGPQHHPQQLHTRIQHGTTSPPMPTQSELRRWLTQGAQLIAPLLAPEDQSQGFTWCCGALQQQGLRTVQGRLRRAQAAALLDSCRAAEAAEILQAGPGLRLMGLHSC